MKNETLSDLVDSTNQTIDFNSEKADESNENVKMVIRRLISSNDTKEGLKIRPNQPQRNGFPLKKDDSGVYMKAREKLILRIDHLPSLTSQNQDISLL